MSRTDLANGRDTANSRTIPTPLTAAVSALVAERYPEGVQDAREAFDLGSACVVLAKAAGNRSSSILRLAVAHAIAELARLELRRDGDEPPEATATAALELAAEAVRWSRAVPPGSSVNVASVFRRAADAIEAAEQESEPEWLTELRERLTEHAAPTRMHVSRPRA